MKFFCEQCKAKYQIADDKVAGKTVRMKCRKCGHVIELRAEVTESSAIAHAPPASVPPAGEAGNKPLAPKPPARPPPRPSALATSLTSAKPAPPRPANPPGGALAGAFKSNVQRESEESSTPFDMADLAPGDDWYVAVNGVPVGPIRIAEVRRKAALGAVTEDSLVWQEGLDEWRPLRTFPDLAANVREAAAGGRISITPAPPDVVRPSSPPPPRSPSVRTGSPSAVPQRVGSARPVQTPSPAARSNVVPITSRLATAERLDDAPTEIGTFQPLPSAAPDPFAVPAAPAAAAAALVAPPPPALERPAAAVAPASLTPSPPSVTPSRRKETNFLGIAVIAGAIVFGGAAAFFLFSKPQSAPATVAPAQTVYIHDQAPAATASAASAPPEPAATAAAPTAVSHGGAVAHASNAAPAPTAKTIDLGGLTHGATISPGEDPGGNEGPAAAGQCLSQGQVSQVMGMHQVGVRRTCWERNQTTKPSVNVSVALTIGPDGSAQNVSATSADDSSVAKCIETEVRTWHFPAMGCSQKTGFSYKFVRQ